MTSWVLTIPEHLKTEKMCNEAVRINLLSLEYVPDHFKVQEMCNEVVRNKLCMLLLVPDHFWTQEMCNEIMRTMPGVFHRIHDHFKTQEMCDKAVKDDSSSLQFIPDWFASTEWVDMWCDDYYDDDGDHWDDDGDEDHFFEWYDGYKNRKAQKASIKEELLPLLGIHQGCRIGGCQKTKKVMRKNFGYKHGLFVPDDRMQKVF